MVIEGARTEPEPKFEDFPMLDEEGKFRMNPGGSALYDLNDMALDAVSLLDHLNIDMFIYAQTKKQKNVYWKI